MNSPAFTGFHLLSTCLSPAFNLPSTLLLPQPHRGVTMVAASLTHPPRSMSRIAATVWYITSLLMLIFTIIFANSMKSRLLISLLLLVFLIPPAYSGRIAPPEPETLSGYVIKILDGDTYDILLADKTQKRIRMEGIDAPEKGMPFYRVSKNYLGSLCFNKTVTVRVTGNDGNRLIGFTYLEDGTELSHAMIEAGLAWHFKKYNTDPGLARLEVKARKKKKGLWIDKNPMAPWDNRSLHRQGVSTKGLFEIQEGQR